MGSVGFHVSKHEGQALPSDAYYTTYLYHMSITFFKISKKIFDGLNESHKHDWLQLVILCLSEHPFILILCIFNDLKFTVLYHLFNPSLNPSKMNNNPFIMNVADKLSFP